MGSWMTRLGGGLLALLLVCGCGETGEPSARRESALTGSALIEPRADLILRQMSEHLGRLKSFRVELEALIDEVDHDGRKIQLAQSGTVEISRPNRMRGITQGDRADKRYLYDGKTVTMFDVPANSYAQVTVPDSIDGMIEHMARTYGVTAPVSDLLVSEVYASLSPSVRLGRYVGLHRVGPYRCHHLAFTQASIDWQVWVEDGPAPWPRKLVIEYKTEPARPQYCATFTRWEPDAAFSSDAFSFTPPADAQRVDLLPIQQP